MALIGEKRYADAVRLIRKDNPFPVACALVCEHPCEARCRRNMIDDSINIRALKRYAVDHCGEVPAPPCAPSTGKKVAVVGGGPGGLSAAYFLSLMGHKVTVFEKRKRLGGMLAYGIPSYRLPAGRLEEDIQHILSTGVEVVHTEVGTELPLKDLREDFDAMYIAIGAQIDKKMGIGTSATACGPISPAKKCWSSAAAMWPWTAPARPSVWAQKTSPASIAAVKPT